jgi:hypothetical protein
MPPVGFKQDFARSNRLTTSKRYKYLLIQGTQIKKEFEIKTVFRPSPHNCRRQCKFSCLVRLGPSLHTHRTTSYRQPGGKGTHCFITVGKRTERNVGLYNSVSTATRYGLDGPGIESRWKARFSAPLQTGPVAQPASYTIGTGSLSRE